MGASDYDTAGGGEWRASRPKSDMLRTLPTPGEARLPQLRIDYVRLWTMWARVVSLPRSAGSLSAFGPHCTHPSRSKVAEANPAAPSFAASCSDHTHCERNWSVPRSLCLHEYVSSKPCRCTMQRWSVGGNRLLSHVQAGSTLLATVVAFKLTGPLRPSCKLLGRIIRATDAETKYT